MSINLEYKHIYRTFGPESIESGLYGHLVSIQENIERNLSLESSRKLVMISVCFDLAGSILDDPVNYGVHRKGYYEKESWIIITAGISIDNVVLPEDQFNEMLRPLFHKIVKAIHDLIEKHNLEVDKDQIENAMLGAICL